MSVQHSAAQWQLYAGPGNAASGWGHACGAGAAAQRCTLRCYAALPSGSPGPPSQRAVTNTTTQQLITNTVMKFKHQKVQVFSWTLNKQRGKLTVVLEVTAAVIFFQYTYPMFSHQWNLQKLNVTLVYTTVWITSYAPNQGPVVTHQPWRCQSARRHSTWVAWTWAPAHTPPCHLSSPHQLMSP